MSLAACISHWPSTTRSPWFPNSLVPDVGLEHRGLGLLGLQEERVLPVATHHQHHPGAGPDASDPDHLAGHFDESVAVEEVAAITLEALAVAAEQFSHPLLELLLLALVE